MDSTVKVSSSHLFHVSCVKMLRSFDNGITEQVSPVCRVELLFGPKEMTEDATKRYLEVKRQIGDECWGALSTAHQREMDEIIRMLQDTAKQGLGDAQFNLGVMYEHGHGVTQDLTESIQWYRKAAEQGVASAQFNLGVMCNDGQGEKCDQDEAINWFRKAASQGFVDAQFNLGVMLTVATDHDEAVRWFRMAADQGYMAAQFNLGFMYEQGQGVERDHIEAIRWYKEAAKQGFTDAQFNLGVMYTMLHDLIEAVRWYQRAAERGHSNARHNLSITLLHISHDTMQRERPFGGAALNFQRCRVGIKRGQ